MSIKKIKFSDDRAVMWLLKHDHPGIRYFALRDLMGVSENGPEASSARSQVASYGPIASLLREENPDGYWGYAEDCYWPKWRASVWQLILLAEMGVPGNDLKIHAACEYFLNIAMKQDKSWPPPNLPFPGLYRQLWEPCVTGNMARTLVEYGYGDDPRVVEMLTWLLETQLPDDGWNCEIGTWGKEVNHSSFMSTIEPLWAFSALDPSRWPKGAKDAVSRGCEFMLNHRLFKSHRDGRVIDEEWTKLHFPMFYFYDILHGLRVLTSLGYGHDERVNDALELLLSKRQPDGKWRMESTFLQTPDFNFAKDPATREWREFKGMGTMSVPAIYSTLGAIGNENPWVTLNALRVLKAIQ